MIDCFALGLSGDWYFDKTGSFSLRRACTALSAASRPRAVPGAGRGLDRASLDKGAGLGLETKVLLRLSVKNSARRSVGRRDE